MLPSCSRPVCAARWVVLALAAACGKPEPAAPVAPAPPEPAPAELPTVLPLAPVPPILVQAAGFDAPESALHDPVADLYLVSNVGGGLLDKDENGFISRVAPDGTVAELKWIGGGADVALHAPKGLALSGDKLFVTDIDVVRSFDRHSGKALGEIPFPNATCLNDVAAAPDGTLYVSDTGLRKVAGVGVPQKSGTDAIYVIDPLGKVSALVKGPELGQPNGLLADNDGVWVASLDGELYQVSRSGARRAVAKLPSAGLDGLARTGSGRLIVSSWEGSAVYAASGADATTSSFSPLISDLDSPADLGYDEQRQKLLVPLFEQNALYVQQVMGG